MVTTVTKTIGATGDYSTVTAWEAATDNDLVTADEIQQGKVLNETVTDTAVVVFAGATIDSTRFRRLMTDNNFDIDDRSGSVITCSATSGDAYDIQEHGFELIGLGVQRSAGGALRVLRVGSSDASGGGKAQLVEKCTIENASSNTGGRGTVVGNTSGQEVDIHFWNNIIINDTASTGDTGLTIVPAISSGVTVRIHNNLVVDWDKGGSSPGVGTNLGSGTNSGTLLVTNTITYGSGGNDWSGMSGLGGTHTEDYNAASDTTAAGTNSIDSLASSAFEDFTAYDFTPSSGGALEDAGEDLSSYFTDDYYGNSRGSSWDIGPIERVSSGQTLTPGPTTMPFAVPAPTMSFGNTNIAATPVTMPFAVVGPTLKFRLYADDSFHVHGSPLAKDTSTSNEDIGWDDATDTSVRAVIRVPFGGVGRTCKLTSATFSIYKTGESGAQSNTVDGDLHYYGATNPGEDDASSDDAATAHSKAVGTDPPIEGNFPTGTDADGQLTTAAFDATNLSVLQRCLYAVNRVTFGIHDDSALVQEGRVLFGDAIDSANPPYLDVVVDPTEGNQVIAPDPVAMPYALPAPTRLLGNINRAASVTTMPFALPAVTMSFGNTNIAAAPTTMPFALPAVTLSFGNTNIAASATAMPFALPTPTLSFGNTNIAASATAMPFALPAVTMSFGNANFAATPVTMPFAIPGVTVDVPGGGDQTILPTAVTMPFAVPAPTRSLGNLNVASSTVVMQMAVPGVTMDFGNATFTPEPVTMPFGVPAPAMAFGNANITPDVVTLPLTVPNPTRVLGNLNIAATAVAMQLNVPAVTFVPGNATLLPDVVTMPFVVPGVTVSGFVTVTLTPDAVTLQFAVPSPVTGQPIIHEEKIYLTISHAQNIYLTQTHDERLRH